MRDAPAVAAPRDLAEEGKAAGVEVEAGVVIEEDGAKEGEEGGGVPGGRAVSEAAQAGRLPTQPGRPVPPASYEAFLASASAKRTASELGADLESAP